MVKRSPEQLPGEREQRVFIGGQYDFMPTLRDLSRFVQEISSAEEKLIPIIPYDYEIAEAETMDRDLEILRQCRYAIFDLSDLGAQLVEMQEARQNSQSIDSLIVYPVRERRNEPARGRRTVLSFGLPHFGYVTFHELKGIVWRFLTDAPTTKDYTPRVIYDPTLDSKTRRVRVLLATGREDQAEEMVKGLLASDAYKLAIEPWLQLAVVGHYRHNEALTKEALSRATEISGTNPAAQAELSYCKGVIDRLKRNPDEARKNLEDADKLKPGDGRILELMGYVYWLLKDRKTAIEKTQKALQDESIPDPLVTISAINNLAYFYCEEVQATGDIKLVNEAYELTAYLPEYHRVFRRRDAPWLDTRGLAAIQKAKHLADQPHERAQAVEVAKIALEVLGEARQLEGENEYIKEHWQLARDLHRELAVGAKPAAKNT